MNNKKFWTGVSAAVAVGLSGCASQPDEIHTQSVSTVPYENFSCTQVGGEMTRVNTRINSLYAQLKKKADDDQAATAIGIIVFWPALFFLEGGDGPEAAEYGRLRGEMDALQQVAVSKSCSDLPKFEDPVQVAIKAKAEAEAKAKASGSVAGGIH